MSVSFSARVRAHGEQWAQPLGDSLEELNLCNGNAAHLLALLELHDGDSWGEMTGEIPAAEFAERVALAEGFDLVGARPGFESARWHEVGTSAHYLRAKLAELAELAREATALTGDAGVGVVSWG